MALQVVSSSPWFFFHNSPNGTLIIRVDYIFTEVKCLGKKKNNPLLNNKFDHLQFLNYLKNLRTLN